MNKIVERNVQQIVTNRRDAFVELLSVVLLWLIGVGILALVSPLLFTINYGILNNLLSVIAPVVVIPLGLFLTIFFWRKHRYDSALLTSFLAFVLILFLIANLQIVNGS